MPAVIEEEEPEQIWREVPWDEEIEDTPEESNEIPEWMLNWIDQVMNRTFEQSLAENPYFRSVSSEPADAHWIMALSWDLTTLCPSSEAAWG